MFVENFLDLAKPLPVTGGLNKGSFRKIALRFNLSFLGIDCGERKGEKILKEKKVFLAESFQTSLRFT